MKGFLENFDELLRQTNPDSILEVGCGEGHMLTAVQHTKPASLYGIDVDYAVLEEARVRSPQSKLYIADGHHLPFTDKSFSLTVACEVLEHVADPKRVIAEISRVTRDYCILSVPREPIWRVLNLVRGKYIRDFGNTPGHVQHWNSISFVNMLEPYIDVILVYQPLPWTMVLASIRHSTNQSNP